MRSFGEEKEKWVNGWMIVAKWGDFQGNTRKGGVWEGEVGWEDWGVIVVGVKGRR